MYPLSRLLANKVVLFSPLGINILRIAKLTTHYLSTPLPMRLPYIRIEVYGGEGSTSYDQTRGNN